MSHPLYRDGSAPALVAMLGDTHGESIAVRRAVDKAAAHTDLIIQLGDFGLWPGVGGEAFIDDISTWLERRGVSLCWIDGNHDWHDRIDDLPVDPATGLRQISARVWHLPRGYRWDWNGTTWMALGGAVSLDRDHRTPGRSWWPQEVVTDADVERAGDDPVDVLLTHDVAAGVPTIDRWAMQSAGQWPEGLRHEANVTRTRLRSVVDATRPSHVWHGHWRRRYTDQLMLDDGHIVHVEGLADGSMPWSENVVLADTSGAFVAWPLPT